MEERFFPCNSANFLSVKIVSSYVGFPIDVYGTVIARDMLDRKCVYLFRCDRDHSHLILNKHQLISMLTFQQEEQLILTGPKRGLALIDAIYIEIDLKIKGAGKQKKDKQPSKGYTEVKNDPDRFKEDMVVEPSLNSMLSEVVVKCAVEKYAVEATIAIEVVQGKFCGEITACTTNIQHCLEHSLVLYDTKLISAGMTDKRDIPLLRRIIAVGLKEKLIVTIARAGVCKADRKRTIMFIPSVNNRDEAEVFCGSVKILVKVAWSIISHERLDYW
ncbi:hypothetical protein PR202_gb25193 [Eleusine coracana subsp. coracana]|uniref:DUF6598 domain-containing protein n=1 Tax=Eleusine coracana subsp. coracana TaxID=191504 RepID=A0AAV5FKY6_ELECO|nr:hypothetical protein PR202_gb25193 [Eleusine coracana subsp. coracana]